MRFPHTGARGWSNSSWMLPKVGPRRWPFRRACGLRRDALGSVGQAHLRRRVEYLRVEPLDEVPQPAHALLEHRVGAPLLDRLVIGPRAETDEAGGLLPIAEGPGPARAANALDRPLGEGAPLQGELVLASRLHVPFARRVRHRCPFRYMITSRR